MPQSQPSVLVLFWLTLVLFFAGLTAVWSNHFQGGFHLDDSHTILKNRAIRSLSNVPGFFSNPRSSSSRQDRAEYAPVLMTAFALDYALQGKAEPIIFQLENLFWFLLEIALLYAVFRLIPGVTHYSALFAVALAALHPLAAETVNYALQRQAIYTATGVIAGLLFWIVFPYRLPADFQLTGPRVPRSDWDVLRMKIRPGISTLYKAVIKLPFYILPVLLAMLSGPAGVVFALLLIVWIVLFETERRLRSAIPAGILCGGIWFFQCFVTWKFSGTSRIPTLQYLITQPWVTLGYFYKFLVPLGYTAVTSRVPFPHPWSPLAIAGLLGVAVLIWLASRLARLPEWRAVSFGLWWFLLALLPYALIPQTEVEANPRMFLAYAGLAIALARTCSIVLPRIRMSSPIAGAILATIFLSFCGWETYHRTMVWNSEEALLKDVVDKHPKDGRALMRYGKTLIESSGFDPFEVDFDIGYSYLVRAAVLRPDDPEPETELGVVSRRAGRDAEAEKHFRRAIALNPPYGPAFASYGEWMLAHQRLSEAFDLATRAVQIDRMDTAGRRTLAEIYVQRNDWPNALRVSGENLRQDPDDPDAQRLVHVAQAGIDEVENAKKQAAANPSVEGYLSLAVIYFHDGKYQESIEADREALKLQPELAEAWSNIAAGYHQLGNSDETIAALREAMRLKPNLPNVKNNLAFELSQKPGAGRTLNR